MANEVRLICANALLEEMDKFANPMPNQSGYEFLRGIAAAITEIEDAPTVDAVPVVHGRWIKGDGLKNTKFIPCSGILYCSNCKNEAYWDTDYGQQKFDYCPNCGAKMDGDGDG